MEPGAPRTRWLALAALAIFALLLPQVLALGYGRDQGIYAVVGHELLDGGVPYRDAWDFKPPGIFFLFAASRWLFGPEPWAIRLLECLGLCATVGAMVHIGRHAWRDAHLGLVAGVLLLVGHLGLNFWHTAQPESFGGMLTVGALACAARRGARPRALLAAGVLVGAATLCKPTLAAVGGALAVELVWRRRSARPAVWLAAGGLVPIALCVGWFHARGGYEALAEALFRFAPGYTAVSWQGTDLGWLAWETVRRAWWFMPPLSLAGLPLLLCRRAYREPLVLALGLAVVLELAGVALQAKLFAYHYAGIQPLLALLAALGYRRFFQGARRRPLRIVGALAAAALFGVVFLARGTLGAQTRLALAHYELLLGGLRDHALADELASAADVDCSQNRAVAEALRARVPAGDTVLVWGFEPVLHELSGRAPASRFIYDVPLRTPWSADALRPELMAELARRPPGAIVVEHGDLLDWVTGTAEDSAEALLDFPELRSFIVDDYFLAHRIGDFDVYLARRLAPDD
ncbi:MAG: glycosyltransferase family 39 protein [Polyangiaceae bacterium]|nr:glycosyltransferase family 39 protein [Polyangiaceae bacterium]